MIAALGALCLAVYNAVTGQAIDGFDEACAVLLFYQIGEWLQKYATGKSRSSIEHLMNLRPDYANLVIENNVKKVNPDEVEVGAIIVVYPGEKIPLDGIVVNGLSDIDTKSITGESLPKNVKKDDEVLSGCVNLSAQITIRVTKAFYDSTATKILDLVENAATKKAKTENFITKFARYYTPIVIISAVLLLLLTGIFSQNWGVSLYRALSFLVVSCPCALVISVPLSFFMALGSASKQGILIKGSNYLEKLNHAQIYIFDKTGTLTKGNFAITEIAPKEKRDQILALAAIAEKDSNHPIARSIVSAYNSEIESGYTIRNIAGEGVIATKDKDIIYCGSAKLLSDNKINFQSHDAVGTIVYVARNQTYLGHIVIQDEVKPESIDVIKELNNMSARTMILTGDNETVARNVAKNLGVTSYRANLLPQDKLTEVEKLFKTKKSADSLCYIGDGINDAPVLMRADVGITMGGIGSDAALEASDVVLMHDDLHGVLKAKKIAKKTMKIVKENIIFSIIVKLGILTLSALGITNMWMAIFGDVGVARRAILNAFRLKGKYN
ncbi:MAG: cadmium-translocating P-type ATPase [Clostridia bacterium]|nr:cadmium-translocating P-type ATPase [Clostridia bacterium]